MTATLFVGLLVFAVVATVTPGPNNLMMMASGANFGLRRTIPHMAGVTLGFGAMTLMVGLGLAGLFHTLPWLYAVLRWGAALYILYLAWRMATATGVGSARSGERPMRFWEAVAFQWINPKAWVMALGAITTYAQPGHLPRDVAIIAGLFVLITIPGSLSWSAFGVGIKRFLRPRWALRTFNGVMAAALVASLYPLITEPPATAHPQATRSTNAVGPRP
jgi:threonine/homoserine/homoserine lactone efflux protein